MKSLSRHVSPDLGKDHFLKPDRRLAGSMKPSISRITRTAKGRDKDRCGVLLDGLGEGHGGKIPPEINLCNAKNNSCNARNPNSYSRRQPTPHMNLRPYSLEIPPHFDAYALCDSARCFERVCSDKTWQGKRIIRRAITLWKAKVKNLGDGPHDYPAIASLSVTRAILEHKNKALPSPKDPAVMALAPKLAALPDFQDMKPTIRIIDPRL